MAPPLTKEQQEEFARQKQRAQLSDERTRTQQVERANRSRGRKGPEKDIDTPKKTKWIRKWNTGDVDRDIDL